MEIFDLELQDTVKARVQDGNGRYHYKGSTEGKIDSQQILLERSLKYIPED